MRVALSFSIALVLAMGATAASAQSKKEANEILDRLRAQAANVATRQADQGSVTRGLAVSYGNNEPKAPAIASAPARPAPSVTTAAPAIAAAPVAVPAPSQSYVSVDTPSMPAASPAPAYVMQSGTAEPAYTELQPSVTIAAPSYQAEPTAAPAPAYAEIPTFTRVETPAIVPVAASAVDQGYQKVADDTRVDLHIFFEWNSASLRPEAIGQLSELCTAIRDFGASADNRFKIIGHTDKSGSDEYNLYLSNARAREVKRHLVEECALPAEALLAVGEGERQSSPSTPSNAPQERRVEIQFVS